MYRTNTCAELSIKDNGHTVKLCGWVHNIRALGSIMFVDLRDRSGIIQILFDNTAKLWETIGREDVVSIEGKVKERKDKNPNMDTGEIEVIANKMEILNKSKVPPFTIRENTDGGEELRMKYRFLDIRRPSIQHKLKLRHLIAQQTRSYLIKNSFWELETPFLIKSTPEGARDFVIPSRVNEGHFYALPQSPQLFKQLFMIGGYDRYFQIVRCFRDEDLRSDRQPEFTQVDCEMSFVYAKDVMRTFEGLLAHLIKAVHEIDIPTPIQTMTWENALQNYGTDKPDTRFDMKIQNIKVNGKTSLAAIENGAFQVFSKAESLLGLVLDQKATSYSRKEIDTLTKWVQTPQIGMKGLAYLMLRDSNLKSSFDKFFSQEELQSVASYCHMKEGDILFLLAGEDDTTRKATAALRLHIARKEELIKPKRFAPLWVTDFPLFEYEKDSNRWNAMHHPFTAPQQQDIDKLNQASTFGEIKAQAYDLVVNGAEIGGGSIRIHQRELQEKVFQALGLSIRETQEKFGFLLSALEYGAPPHGGIALGFDRLCAVINGEHSIRDYIAFPKNNQGRDTMIDAPSKI